MRRILTILFVALITALPAFAQTTVTIPNTVALANARRPGINIGPSLNYGNAQLMKELNYYNNPYVPLAYYQAAFQCSQGGTQTATSWYNSDSGASGYPANFWVGATYQAISQTGTSLGTGTISASTANTSAGTTFTLGTALSAACTTGTNTTATDILIVRKRTPAASANPSDLYLHLSGTVAYNADAPSGYQQSLQFAPNASNTDYIDAVETESYTGSNRALTYINLNGSYTAGYYAKCLTTCTISYQVSRLNAVIYSSGTDTPTVNATAGAGWQKFAHTFTAAETAGSNNLPVTYILTCNTGTCLISYHGLIEGSTLSANTTVYRDAVFKELQAINPGSIRFMNPSDWGTYEGAMVSSDAQMPASGLATNDHTALNMPVSYTDELGLAYALGVDAQITMGKFSTPGDYTALMSYLGSTNAPGQTQTWTALFAAKNLHIYVALGNEAWNARAGGEMGGGNGAAYGYLVGQIMPVAKAATGYNSSVIKLMVSGWAAGNQAFSQYGWVATVLNAAGCSNSAPTHCPDFVELAPYTLNTLSSLANVYQDEVAEIINTDSTTNQSSGSNILLDQQYVSGAYPVSNSIYEVSYSPTSGTATPTAVQMSQITGGVGMGMNVVEHMLLMRRDARIPGPIHEFAFVDFGGAASVNSTESAAWEGERSLACGPGQINTCNAVGNGVTIALKTVNAALGNNTNLLATTQSGTPTTSYAAGQGATIPANSAVPSVNCTAYNSAAGANYSIVCFNHSATTQPVSFTGAGAPLSSTSVSYATLGGTTNAVTDNNLAYTDGTGGTPTVQVPISASGTGLNSDTLPAESMRVYSYSLGGGSGNGSGGSGNTPATIISTTFNEGAAGAFIGGTKPATDTPGSTWSDPAYQCYTFSANGATTSCTDLGNALNISAGASDYSVTYTWPSFTGTGVVEDVQVRRTDSNNYYEVRVNTSGFIDADSIVAGSRSGTSINITVADPTQPLTVTVQGTSVTLSCDGQTVTGSVDPSLTGTFVGFASPASGTSVKSMTVTTPQSSAPTPAASTTSLSASSTTPTAGQPITLTATVSNTAATGSVTFSDGSTTLGTGTVSNGVATYTVPSITAGSHSFTAAYSGDSNYAASTSSAVSVTASTTQLTATATTLVASPVSANTGQSVTITATVSSNAASGTVQITDGATTIATVPLSAGVASYTVSSITTGSHVYGATYSGDSSYASSASATVTVVATVYVPPSGSTNLLANKITANLGGTLLASGQLCLTPVDTSSGRIEGFTSMSGQQVLPAPACFTITNGSIGASVYVPDTSTVEPMGVGYKLQVEQTNGVLLYTIGVVPVSGSTFDLGTWAPTQSTPVSYPGIRFSSTVPQGRCGTAPGLAYTSTALYACVSQIWVQLP